MMKRAMIIAAGLAVFSTPVLADTPKLEGTYSDWSVYTRDAGGDKICYVLTKPKTMSPSNVSHGDIYFMVSNWRSGAATEQPSFLAGYELKSTRAPKASVGSTEVTMYGADNEAFIDSTSEEKKLVQKMRAGSTLTVEAVSARGTTTRYSFSLKGVTAALKKARGACAQP